LIALSIFQLLFEFFVMPMVGMLSYETDPELMAL